MASVQKVIGPGEAGGKTSALIRDKAAIERAGLFLPNYVGFTPQFFERFLNDSGAMESANRLEAVTRIDMHKFSLEEKDAFRGAATELVSEYAPVIMVRSDEPYVTGIWETNPVSTRSHSKREKLTEDVTNEIELRIKDVLASDFSDSAIEFKRKMGNETNPGVMFMPLVGDMLRLEKQFYMAPRLSVSYLGKVNGSSLVAAGAGVGGANLSVRMGARRMRTSNPPSGKFFEIVMGGNDISAVKLSDSTTDFINAPSVHFSAFDKLLSFGSKIENLLKELGQRHLELVWTAEYCPQGAVVQSRQLGIPAIEMPAVDKKSVVVQTSDVMGTKLAQAKKIRYTVGSQTEGEVNFNKENNDYLLIVKTGVAWGFAKQWTLPAFSNAAAVVLLTETKYSGHELSTHLGGYFRDLNIPILQGDISTTLLESLQKQPVQNIKSLIYADEFHPDGPRGFVSLE